MKRFIKLILQMFWPNLLIYRRYRRYLRMPIEQYPQELKRIYQERTGHTLDLKQPMRFTEKIQWRKLYDNHDAYAILSDKYAVRSWVEKKIGVKYLIPLLESWDKPDEVSIQRLPSSFVIKTNNSCGTNILVRDKQVLDMQKVRKELKQWLQTPFWFNNGFEMHYSKIKPIIFAEEYLKQNDGAQDLVDYKFYCFHGIPTYCQVIHNRSKQETIDFFDMKWRHMEFTGLNRHARKSEEPIAAPATFPEMFAVSEKLSSGFAFVRVDLYDVNGRVYFGEMTFTPGSGFGHFTPDDWDYRLGSLWNIDIKQVNEEIVGL